MFQVFRTVVAAYAYPLDAQQFQGRMPSKSASSPDYSFVLKNINTQRSDFYKNKVVWNRQHEYMWYGQCLTCITRHYCRSHHHYKPCRPVLWAFPFVLASDIVFLPVLLHWPHHSLRLEDVPVAQY